MRKIIQKRQGTKISYRFFYILLPPCPNKKAIHQALDNTQMHAVGQSIEADNTVNNGANITYQAGDSIILKAGFHAKAGADFLAKIAACPTSGFETGGFVQRSSDTLEYDAEGNMVRDPHKGIDILFNYHNLPYQITFDNGNSIEWLYGGTGAKLQLQTKQNGIINPLLTQDYFDGIEYKNDTLEAIYLGDAKAIFDSLGAFKEYQFYLKDNVGNNRIVFKNNGSGVAMVVNESHYYPHGGLMVGSWQKDSRAKYLYNGIEKVSNFGLNVYHAKFRTLDQWSGRWWQIDPEVEQFYSLTPYNSNLNNPIRYSDRDGDLPVPVVTGAIGAGVGFIIGGAASVIGSLWRGESVSLKEVGKAAVAGGVSGAVVGSGAALLGGGLVATAGIGVVSGAAGEATHQGLDMIDGTREVGDFDGEAIAVNGAIAGPLNVVAGGAGKALKGALAPAKGTVKAAQTKVGDAVKAVGGTKAEFKAARSAAKKEEKAALIKTSSRVQAGAQAVSGTINGSGRKNANDKLNNNDND